MIRTGYAAVNTQWASAGKILRLAIIQKEKMILTAQANIEALQVITELV